MENIPSEHHVQYSSHSATHYDKGHSSTLQPSKGSKGGATHEEDTSFLMDEYSRSSLLFRRYNNQNCNRRDNVQFISGMFIKKDGKNAILLPEVNGKIKDDQL